MREGRDVERERFSGARPGADDEPPARPGVDVEEQPAGRLELEFREPQFVAPGPEEGRKRLPADGSEADVDSEALKDLRRREVPARVAARPPGEAEVGYK